MTLVGRHIGRYRILEQLGQGGMSVVYKGLDTTLDREVAVKVLHPHLANKDESRKRLAREAKAVARLHHPNILEVYDFAGADATDAYIVCEYIRGETLRQFAASHTFDPPEIAAMVVHEIASALAHAHEAGIIHRDLKPENVMVRDDGVLKLMDFGIAKIIDRDDKMTMTGALVGSPAHMAPEIIEGHEAGAEADVFSLGTMLFLFTTGRLPFTGANTTATLKRILDGAYDDPRQLVPSVSDDLAEIIAICLMRQPAQRYPSATDLRDALARYLQQLGITRIGEELASFFSDPASYRPSLVKRLVSALIARGEQFVREKRPAKAMGAWNQVLGLDAGNARALALVQQMNQSRQRHERNARWLRVGLSSLVAGAVVAGGYWGWARATRPADLALRPVVQTPTDVAVPAEVFPPEREPPPPALAVEAPVAAPVKPPKAPTVAVVKPPAVTPAEAPTATVEKPPLVDVKVYVKPFGFGYLSVDDGPRTADPQAVHSLKLSPGKHTLVVTCAACVEEGLRREVDVSSAQSVFNLAAPLKPSTLSFAGFPSNALVSVRGQQKTVKESQGTPFKVEVPQAGATKVAHEVDYEVSLRGFKTRRATVTLKPGEAGQVEGALEPE